MGQKAEILTGRNAEVSFWFQFSWRGWRWKKKRSGKDLCQGRVIIAASQVTDHVFGILWISFNLRASPDWEFIQTWTLDANTRRILSAPLWHSHHCYLRLYVKVTTECLQSEGLTCFVSGIPNARLCSSWGFLEILKVMIWLSKYHRQYFGLNSLKLTSGVVCCTV